MPNSIQHCQCPYSGVVGVVCGSGSGSGGGSSSSSPYSCLSFSALIQIGEHFISVE